MHQTQYDKHRNSIGVTGNNPTKNFRGNNTQEVHYGDVNIASMPEIHAGDTRNGQVLA